MAKARNQFDGDLISTCEKNVIHNVVLRLKFLMRYEN